MMQIWRVRVGHPALNAMSQFALDLSDGISYARVPAHPNLQARVGFTYMLWFKSNGLASDYSQILSKRDGTLSPYFIQVEQGGSGVKSLFRFFATYFDNGTFQINPYQWHFLASTYDGEKFKTYLDGVYVVHCQKRIPFLLKMVIWVLEGHLTEVICSKDGLMMFVFTSKHFQ